MLFQWDVIPETEIYRKQDFRLVFPEEISLDDVPEALWWTVFVMCLHANWALLCPCEVHLPVKLPTGHADTWSRLVLTYVDSLDAMNRERDLPRAFKMVEGERELGPFRRLAWNDATAVSFSGGKDSLVQTGLLLEMGFKPILVSTNSLLMDESPFAAVHRQFALQEMNARAGLPTVEVQSDLRSTWNNLVSRSWGFGRSMNELSDTHLYTAVMIVCGYVYGATRLFLASETELAQIEAHEGRYLQHPHFMYSALTQAVFNALLQPFGLRHGSLSTSLHSVQVQQLLTLRYEAFSDLQTSCWLFDESSKACSVCGECKKLGWATLSVGGSPAKLGVNIIKMIQAWADYVPKRKQKNIDPDGAEKRPEIYGPVAAVAQNIRPQNARAILSVTPDQLMDYIKKQHPEALLDGSADKAVQNLLQIQEETREEFQEVPPAARYRPALLQSLDSEIAEGLKLILDDQFEEEDFQSYSDLLACLKAAIAEVTISLMPGTQEERSYET